MVRRRLILPNLAYLALVLIVMFGGWLGARAWFDGWRTEIERKWSSFDNDRWKNLMPPGSDAAEPLLVARADGEHKALLLLACVEAKVRLLSKTIIDQDDAFKPHSGEPQKVDVRLFSTGRPEVRLAGASWYFIKGLDMVLTPELPGAAISFLENVLREGPNARFSMHHSETAIYVRPAVTTDALRVFRDRCLHPGVLN